MKTFFSILFLLTLRVSVFAQYSTDKFSVYYNVRHIPEFYVEPQDRTFGVYFNGPKQIKNAVDFKNLYNFYAPLGWRPDKGNPYMIINFEVDYLEIQKSYEVEDTVKRIFFPAMDYTIPIHITVETPQNKSEYTNALNASILEKPTIYTYISEKGFRTIDDANDFFVDNKDIIIEEEINKRIYDFYAETQKSINNDYVYYPKDENIHVWLLDNKKNEFYKDYKKSKENIKTIFHNLNATGGQEDVIKEIKPYIELIKEEINSLNEKEKKQRSAKINLLYGLSEIYYALEIFDVSEDYAKQVSSFDDSRGDKQMKAIENYKKELKKHHINSKHFEITF